MANEELQRRFGSLSTVEDIEGLKGQRETVHLEFKEKATAANPELEKSDKKNFATALSGFANSDGGILIWGIEDHNNVAVGFKPIMEPNVFADRLGSLVLDSTAPVVGGVEIVPIVGAGGDKIGYVKCFIPASDSGPHRAELGDKQYFKRSATNFYPLEHFDIEDMFGRRLKPSLHVHLVLSAGQEKDQREIRFFISNDGKWLAKYPGLLCRFLGGTKIVKATDHITDQSSSNHGFATVTYQEHVGVVHPNRVQSYIGSVVIVTSDPLGDVPFDIMWYCEGMAVRKKQGTLKHDQMITLKPALAT